MGRSTDKVGGYCGRGSSCRCCWQCCPPPCPIQWLRPPTLTSLPQLPPTSPPPLSRPTTLLSQSSRTSLPLEPRLSLDPSVLTRLFTSQLSTRPALTPSRLSLRLLPPLSTLLLRSQLLLPMLLQLLLLPMLLPQLPTLPTLLPQLPTLPTLLPQLLLPDTPLLLPQPLLLKQYPKLSSVPKSEPEIGLYRLCAVSEFLRHTKLYNRKVGVSWWLFLVSLWTTSNVSLALQYDVTTIITSGIFLLLNVHYVRYRRELFINKSVLF